MFAGKGVESLLQEAGGHRVQRVPPNERRGRVHTSSVTVAVYPATCKQPVPTLNKDSVRIEWFSGTGSGGQHRNKCQNSCRVIHKETGLVETRQGRSRDANFKHALEALRVRLDNMLNENASANVNAQRRGQIGQGLRGDKIRTYRAQHDDVINHLNGKTCRYKSLMRGGFPDLWGD